MKKISYNVKVNKKSLLLKIRKDENYINNLMAQIIYKRREKKCYENSSN